MKIENDFDLFAFMATQAEGGGIVNFLSSQAQNGNKQWFGFLQQKITGISLAHQIAALHADKFTPEEAVDYAMRVNEVIYHKIIKIR